MVVVDDTGVDLLALTIFLSDDCGCERVSVSSLYLKAKILTATTTGFLSCLFARTILRSACNPDGRASPLLLSISFNKRKKVNRGRTVLPHGDFGGGEGSTCRVGRNAAVWPPPLRASDQIK